MKLLIALALAAAPSALAMAPYVPDDEGPTAMPSASPTKDPTPAPTKAPVGPIPGPSWTQLMQQGFMPDTGPECTSFNAWRFSLTGAETSITASANGATVTCDDPVKAAEITTYIRDASAGTGPSIGFDQAITCGGFTWAFGSCKEGPFTIPSLEIHAAGTTGICDSCISAGPAEITMRPCINNANWGGGNGPICGAPTQTFVITTTL